MVLSACGGGSSPSTLDFDDPNNPDSKTDLPTFGDEDGETGATTEETSTATTAAPTTPPPPPTTLVPELVVDATGDDFDRIYRELDGARSYLFSNPSAGDPTLYAGPRGGANNIEFLAANNYRLERGPDYVYTVDQVTMQARVGDNNVQLLVIDTATGTSTVVDETGAIKHTRGERDSDTQTYFVELEREPGGPWRLMGDNAIISIDDVTIETPAYVPAGLPLPEETTELKTGTVTTKTGEYRYSTHLFVAVDGSSCTEVRILNDSGEPRSRYAECIQKSTMDRMVENQELFSVDTVFERDRLTVLSHYSPDVPINTRYGFKTQPFLALGTNATTNGFAVDVAVSGERPDGRRLTFNGDTIADDKFFGEYFCDEWGTNHTVARSALSDNGIDGETRVADRAALVEVINDHADDAWYVPQAITTSDGQPPAIFVEGAIEDLPEFPDWHVVEIVEPDADHIGATITWAFALSSDADGWFIEAWGVHKAC